MRRRNSIPSRYWTAIADAAKPLNLPITFDTLAKAEAKSRAADSGSAAPSPSSPAPEAGAAR